ncbi:YafY family transcriptional regulator [Clostridium sp. YIM B02505]|uniref:YafY family transcriptional regulator n=1 Tax=Clostridium yunnanense TaxID=2800325 RepID=A0ABS1EKU4_9CLOT|nr:YafY family protein [Clostridium yunnanense]MBK1809991.1 YafY family transcriptional regulator [Clostridium yunnanense]
MQISRLFQIIYILLEKRSITAGELAEKFEVSVRTIYRDIDALCQAGIPIYASQGKGGGISLIDKFVLDKSLFSEREQDKILLALQSLSALQYPELDEVLSKLSGIFKKSNVSWIEVDFSDWGSEKNQNEAFRLLKDAILEQLIITFSYFNANGEKSNRKIEPFKLLFKHKDWYMQGYCLEKEALRTFKINRITNIHITEEQCVHQVSKDYITNSVAEVDKERINLVLKISKEGAYRVYDDFDEENITKHEDGSYTVKVSMPNGEWIYNYLLSFGTVLEVIEPESIREEIALRLNHMVNKYN